MNWKIPNFIRKVVLEVSFFSDNPAHGTYIYILLLYGSLPPYSLDSHEYDDVHEWKVKSVKGGRFRSENEIIWIGPKINIFFF